MARCGLTRACSASLSTESGDRSGYVRRNPLMFPQKTGRVAEMTGVSPTVRAGRQSVVPRGHVHGLGVQDLRHVRHRQGETLQIAQPEGRQRFDVMQSMKLINERFNQ